MERKEIIKLILAVLVSEFAGMVGSLFTFPSIVGWYAGLRKPGFTPPNWLFGPVWITLYFLMGVSLYLAWKKGLSKKRVKGSMEMFGVQLALNALWSVLFFGLHSPLYGLICIAALWIAIVATMVKFYGISKEAVALLLPYILWTTIAMALNYYIWILN
jgi:tryptophan-rich sensory protein